MYSFEQHLPNKLYLYPYWASQNRTLEEWNTTLPKRRKPIQPVKTDKKAFWNYQYSYNFYSYEVTNYKRDKIQAIINDPLQIFEVVTFIKNHNQGWQLPPPSIGVHFDIVQLDILFYRGDNFLGSIGLNNRNTLAILIKDKTKHYAHQYLKIMSDEEAKLLFRLTNLDWDKTLLM